MEAKPKRLKILFTIPNFDTAGSGKALLNIATRLDSNKFEPHIMCMHDRGDFFTIVKHSGIPVHLMEYTTPMKPYWKGLWNCWKISRAFKKIAPHLIHSFHYSSDYSEPLAARMAGIKWMFTKKNMMWGGSSKNSWYVRSKLATGIIAQNSEMLNSFFPNKRKVTLIPRGVDTEKFAPEQPDEILCKSFHIQDTDRIIICVAHLVPIKGVEVLLDAFSLLSPNFQRWKVLIVGNDSTEYGKSLKEKVDKLGLNNRIIFAGNQQQVKLFLDMAEIFVLPTLERGEGSPIAMLESMANGKAVLGSKVPGIRDQLEGFPEMLFNSNDVNDLKNKLESTMRLDRAMLKKIGDKFRILCLSKFDITREVENHEEFYNRICTH